MSQSSTPRYNNLSYIKGCAILGVVLIHLIDWCEVHWSPSFLLLKEFLFPFVILFVVTSGSLVVIASQKYDLKTSSARFFKRGIEIILIYWIYSGIKLVIFNFDHQPFFAQLSHQGIMAFKDIFLFRAYDVPITILASIGFFITISPLLLWSLHKTKHPKIFLISLISLLTTINYLLPTPNNPIVNFLYSNGYVIFPLALWFVPFLLGMLIAYYEMEQTNKTIQLLFWGIATLLCYSAWLHSGQTSWQPSSAMYPLHPFMISFSLFYMFLLMIGFSVIEKYRSKTVQTLLKILKLLGDNTLELYIAHWIVIDMTAWFLYRHMGLIWINVSLLFIGFIFWKRDFSLSSRT